MAEKRCVYKCGAWNCGSYQFNLYKDDIDQGELCDVHYTPPAAQRPWQGLTDEEILRADPWEILRADPWRGPSDSNINPYQILLKVRTLEAKLKERNT